MTAAIELLVREYAGLDRVDEPVRLGVPLGVGAADVSAAWSLVDAAGRPVACQTRVLAQWPGLGVKWLLCDFQASVAAGRTAVYQLSQAPPKAAGTQPAAGPALQVEELPHATVVTTGSCRFEINKRGAAFLGAVTRGRWICLGLAGSKLSYRDAQGKNRPARIESVAIAEQGPVRVTIFVHGSFAGKQELRFVAMLDFYAGSGLMRVTLTLQNPARARHSGGYWDLGDPGSVLMGDLTLAIFPATLRAERLLHWTEQPGSDSRQTADTTWEIYQDSSGGENWRSRNHLNRNGEIPLQFRGFRLSYDGEEHFGLRASPTVCLETSAGGVRCVPLEFWQKFPTAIQVTPDSISWQPFPPQAADLHELQAGEHSTHVAWFEFGAPSSDPCRGLAWPHVPLEVRCRSEQYAASGAIPNLPCPEMPLRPELQIILADALDGPRNFFHKREVVDEYGWRHFGDTWADHEEAYYPGPHKPILSHFNNQFDLLLGMLVEYLRGGERRWWDLAGPLARHVIDIDIYHTDRDRAAYSGGLFWPTNHYYDAGTCTHRSMARAMREIGTTGVGGGPGSEHNFAGGLLLYHYLTGEKSARDAVVELADWVIAMDDGDQHLLGLLSSAPTGTASGTAGKLWSEAYHGPGRAAANSLQSLLEAWSVTANSRYLDQAEEIIRRTIHPADDVSAFQLDNPELRWSYTMYLQALFRYLQIALAAGRSDFMARYARESLLHYGRWMVAYERFYLDEPENLEYPTETWAGQELRKGTVVLMLAQLVAPDEHEIFRRRAMEMLDRAWESLLAFPTRDYTRPLALVLRQGYLEAGLTSEPPTRDVSSNGRFDPGAPTEFVPQKQHVRDSLSSMRGLAHMVARLVRPTGWRNVVRRSWIAQRMRHVISKLGK